MSAIENMRKMINLMETAVGRSRRRLNEGKMKELWMLIKQGKSAEEIAEILNVDVETIKSFMAKEEIGEADAASTKPDTAGWKPSIVKGKKELASHRKKGYDDDRIANLMFQTNQNVPRKYFKIWLDAVGGKKLAKNFK